MTDYLKSAEVMAENPYKSVTATLDAALATTSTDHAFTPGPLLGYWFARADDSMPAAGDGSWTGRIFTSLGAAREYAEGRPLRVVAVYEIGGES